jgi:hypothetical protein
MLQVLVSTPLPLVLLSLPGKGVQPLRRGFLVARTSLAVKASPHLTSHVFSLPFNPFFIFKLPPILFFYSFFCCLFKERCLFGYFFVVVRSKAGRLYLVNVCVGYDRITMTFFLLFSL